MPRVRGFPKEPRLPGVLTLVQGQAGTETEDTLFEARFLTLKGRYPAITRPEARVMLWLVKHFGQDSQGQDWVYTPTLGTSFRDTGISVDFLILSTAAGTRVVWQVQGEHFHFGDPATEAQDLVERDVLESEGYIVINLLESQINQDVDRVCRAGLRGEQLYEDPILGSGRGFPGDASVKTRAR